MNGLDNRKISPTVGYLLINKMRILSKNAK